MNKKRTNNRFTDTLKNKLRNQFVHGIVIDGETTFPTLDNLITKNKLAKRLDALNLISKPFSVL